MAVLCEKVLGMFVSGDPLRSPGPHGEQLHDRSFLLWLNAGHDPVDLNLPENDWVATGEVVLSTDPAHTVGTPVKGGQVMRLEGRSVLLLRET